MKITKFPEFDEILYEKKFANGLTVFALKKNELNVSVGALGVKFGSVDESYQLNSKTKKVPQGIAHFIEHLIFEKDATNAFDSFNNDGTFINASTSFTDTIYTIKSINDFSNDLLKLLDFVLHPEFNQKNIDKERTIIEHEIKMYTNNISWSATYELLNSLFPQHPIKNHIGGDSESIHEINRELLLNTHSYFYNPNNLTIFMITPLDPEIIFENISKYLLENKFNSIFQKKIVNRKIMDFSHNGIVQHKNIFLPTPTPQVYVGYRLFLNTEDKLLYEIILDLALESLFEVNSKFYKTLKSKNIVYNSLKHTINIDENFAYIIINCKTTSPETLKSTILRTIEEMNIDQYNIKRIKKTKLSSILNSSNSNTWLSTKFIRYYFKGENFLNVIKILQELKVNEIEELSNYIFKKSMHSSLIINKKQ